MIDWLSSVKSLISLADDVPDERLTALVPIGTADLTAMIGATLANTLHHDENSHYILAVSQFLVSRLILALRELSPKLSIPDTGGSGIQWGDGTIRPATGDALITISSHWRALAMETAKFILKEYASDVPDTDPIGWYDV
ncbi:MAG: hypothetical protein Q8M98_05215 [Candidatus Cloacimonadaceae bacterium]|nr:hypothetical protein [Candidatus Cloacimonadaceae bacterium]